MGTVEESGGCIPRAKDTVNTHPEEGKCQALHYGHKFALLALFVSEGKTNNSEKFG